MKPKRSDRRTDRTQRRLRGAFSDLVRQRHYESITVRDIVRGADVGRSTFYEHFSSKDDLLASAITGLFTVLADTCVCDDTSRLTSVLEHFRENRTLAREILNGPAYLKTSAILVRQIETTLKNGRQRRRPLLLPTRLAATQLAGMILAPLTAWLSGASRCTTQTLALALRSTCGAALQAMYVRNR